MLVSLDFSPALILIEQEDGSVGGVCSHPCKKQNAVRDQGENGTFFSVFATNFSTFGLLSFGWITNSCLLVYIHLDADAKWDPVCVQSAPAGQSINMVLHSSPLHPQPPPSCTQTDYNQNKFLWGLSEQIMDNFLLSRKSHSLLCVSPAALQTSRCGKTRAAKESVWIGTRTAGSVITTRPLRGVKAAPSCPP